MNTVIELNITIVVSECALMREQFEVDSRGLIPEHGNEQVDQENVSDQQIDDQQEDHQPVGVGAQAGFRPGFNQGGIVCALYLH